MRAPIQIACIFALIAAVGLAGCDLLDPTNVENPNVLEDDFLRFPDPMSSWLRGMERQMALALNNQNNDLESSYIATAEIASDNYDNTSTFFNAFMDELVINFTDGDVEIPMQEFADLRETAEFGLSTVAAADETTTDSQLAELHFFRGMAHLLTGEVFHLAPADSGGAPVPSGEQFRIALEAFQQALNLTEDPSAVPSYQLALARTYYNLGDAANARMHAEALLADEPDFVRFAGYDNINGPENDAQFAMFDRTQNDLQPLPRLDFLDPKFFTSAEPNTGDDEQADVAYQKAEEAYFIIAEAQLAGGDLAGALATMNDLLELVDDRKRASLLDFGETRKGRPITSGWEVAASPEDTLRSGLVLDRSQTIVLPVISGTSITSEIVASQTTVEEALELLYLLRQEIFFGEGRRMVDLGIKWPVPRDEVLGNTNIAEDSPATQAVVPAFLPPGPEMDAFVQDNDAMEVVILHNLNRTLVENRTSDAVVPFF